MSDFNLLNILERNSSQFRLISFMISTFSMIFLAVMLFIGQQRTPAPEFYSVIYIGVIIAGIQIPLSFYVWKYIPRRIPARYTEYMLITGFRMTMIVALLLCLGVALFAGLAAVITGYAYPPAILGGIALGSMLFHMPGEKRFRDFLLNIG